MVHQQQEQQQEQKQESYSVPVLTTANIWFDKDTKRLVMSIPKEIASKHKISKPCKVSVYDLEQGIFIRFLHYNKQNIK